MAPSCFSPPERGAGEPRRGETEGLFLGVRSDPSAALGGASPCRGGETKRRVLAPSLLGSPKGREGRRVFFIRRACLTFPVNASTRQSIALLRHSRPTRRRPPVGVRKSCRLAEPLRRPWRHLPFQGRQSILNANWHQGGLSWSKDKRKTRLQRAFWTTLDVRKKGNGGL